MKNIYDKTHVFFLVFVSKKDRQIVRAKKYTGALSRLTFPSTI